jgi:DUF4097 and DUF4098 domain-containing protein YvlB
MKFFTLSVFIFSFSAIFAKEYKEDFTHTFQVEKGTTVILKNGDGYVNVRSWDKNEIKVDVFYHINSKSSRDEDDNTFDVEFRQNGDRVYIVGHERRRSAFGFFSIQYIDYRYEISVPSYLAFDIDSDDGDLNLENITGDIHIKADDGDIALKDISNAFTEIKTKDGDVNIKGLKGELSIKADDGTVTLENIDVSDGEVSASDGRIRIRDSKGNFFVDSDDGDISLINIAGEKLEAKTQDGDIDILFAGEGEVSLGIYSNDGSVNVEFDKPISAKFSLETDDGRIKFDVDNADIFKESKRYVTGDIGEGNGRIKVRTSDGSITLNSAY